MGFRLGLLALDVIDFNPSRPIRGEKDSNAPTDWFQRKVEEFGASLSYFERDLDQELILLNRTMRDETRAGAKHRMLIREITKPAGTRKHQPPLSPEASRLGYVWLVKHGWPVGIGCLDPGRNVSFPAALDPAREVQV